MTKGKDISVLKKQVAQRLMEKHNIEPYKVIGKVNVRFTVDVSLRRDIHTTVPKCLIMNVSFNEMDDEEIHVVDHVWIKESRHFPKSKKTIMTATGSLYIYKGIDGVAKCGIKDLKNIKKAT